MADELGTDKKIEVSLINIFDRLAKLEKMKHGHYVYYHPDLKTVNITISKGASAWLKELIENKQWCEGNMIDGYKKEIIEAIK